ncbi:hypothetical protein NSE_0754 [Neorickettsia sennetsu str. Miyayama]|uniref:Uncharacterized protein n=1 Tax=Ehrlichia sennetsu (strain ATCC VR-367 / Miyayama) TaxID=222891 RepID=Q2GD17_EHRS3|nr:hypothetical protein NSE_0754 [Neorickettsia sennetsu str. Miyayama]
MLEGNLSNFGIKIKETKPKIHCRLVNRYLTSFILSKNFPERQMVYQRKKISTIDHMASKWLEQH